MTPKRNRLLSLQGSFFAFRCYVSLIRIIQDIPERFKGLYLLLNGCSLFLGRRNLAIWPRRVGKGFQIRPSEQLHFHTFRELQCAIVKINFNLLLVQFLSLHLQVGLPSRTL